MKETFVTEEQLRDPKSIVTALFYDENDPRSPTYQRKLNRPKIHWWRVILFLLFPVAAVVSLVFGLCRIGLSTTAIALIAVAFALCYFLVMLKRTVICGVRIYQRYAPDRVRNKCRFEPSCSEYMILAIEKYGLIKGFRRGVGRLRRCKPGDGGFDEP